MAASTDSLPPVCRTRDWLNLLGVNATTFYTWCRSGVIPPSVTGKGRMKLWPREVLISFLERGRQNVSA
jgi:predicted site-specific integrase-resolvase